MRIACHFTYLITSLQLFRSRHVLCVYLKVNSFIYKFHVHISLHPLVLFNCCLRVRHLFYLRGVVPQFRRRFNPWNAELNPIRHLLALVGHRHIVHLSRVRVKLPCLHKELETEGRVNRSPCPYMYVSLQNPPCESWHPRRAPIGVQIADSPADMLPFAWLRHFDVLLLRRCSDVIKHKPPVDVYACIFCTEPSVNMTDYSHNRGRNSRFADGVWLTLMFGFASDVLKG